MNFRMPPLALASGLGLAVALIALLSPLAHGQATVPPPPTLGPPAAGAAAPSAVPPALEATEAASDPSPKRRCVAGCDGASARVSWSEDAFNRFEEHRDNREQLVRLFVHPKSGAPRYEVLVGSGRSRQSFSRNGAPNPDPEAQRKDGQPVWEVLKF